MNAVGDENLTANQILSSLTEDEARALAALSIVGQTALAPDLVARLAGNADARRAVEGLRARGLLVEDEEERTGVIRSIADKIRRTEAALATGERLLRALTTLARAEALGRAELEAILNLTGWAAEVGKWRELLELVETVESVWSFVDRVDERVVLLERGVEAARRLGDRAAESRLLRALGDQGAAGEAGPHRRAVRGRSIPRTVIRAGALVAAAGVGLAAGYWLPTAEADPVSTVPVTGTVEVTITGEGTTVVSEATVTDVQTVTTPPETVTVTVFTDTIVNVN